MNGERGCRETPSLFCIRITQDPVARLDTSKATRNQKSLRLISGSFGCVLPWKDSNSHRRNQNPTCYHYTTRQFPQFVINSGGHRYDHFVFDVAKVGSFSELCKFFGRKFSKNFIFTSFQPILGRFHLNNPFQEPSIG